MAFDLLSLNYDVLCIVLSYIDAASASKLSRVSRKAYDISLAHALSSVTISKSQDQLSRFCRVLLADGHTRTLWLRDLTISSSAFGVPRHVEFARFVDFSASDELAQLLECAQRLRRLDISCFESLVAHNSSVGPAIEKLEQLDELCIHNAGESSLELLARLRSQPRKLTFTQLFNRRTPSLFLHLSPLRRLETLELAHLDIPNDEISDEPIQLLSVQTLSLRGTKSRMSHFVTAFPNLRSLTIADMYTDPAIRAENARLPEACWPALDYLHANVADFFHWRITCPVHHLSLEQTAYHYGDALDAIASTRPIILTMPVEARVSQTTFWEDFVKVSTRLRCLELVLEEGRTHRIEAWMNAAPRLLGTLSLRSLCLRVRTFSLPPSTALARVRVGPVEHKPAIPHSTLEDYRTRLMRAIPSLKYISVGAINRAPGSAGVCRDGDANIWWSIESDRLRAIPAGVDLLSASLQSFKDVTVQPVLRAVPLEYAVTAITSS